MTPGRLHHRLFGLSVSTSVAFPGVPEVDGGLEDVRVDAATPGEIAGRFSAPTEHRRTLSQWGGEVTEVILGAAGDLLLDYAGRAQFLIDVQNRQVLCAADDAGALDWRRVLLDTVLVTAGLALGGEALHAGAVEIDGFVVAIAAGTGGGKTTLCAELVRRGARLVTDDVLFVELEGTAPLGQPGPPLMSLTVDGPGTADGLGRVIATLGGEAWLSVDRAAGEARPVAAVVLLERRKETRECRMSGVESPADLLRLALDSGPDAPRVRGRFELVAAVAGRARRLVAPLDTPPADLAAEVASLVSASGPQ